MCRIREGLSEGVGRCFDDNIRWVVGDGRNTLFWHDNWVGEIPFWIKFPWVFDMAVSKECSVEVRVGEWWKGVGVAAQVVGLGGGECEGVLCVTS